MVFQSSRMVSTEKYRVFFIMLQHKWTPIESGICSRRILQYLFHKHHRSENNPITYWRKLVEEYFAPRARERWCVSSYDNRGNSSAAAPQKVLDDQIDCVKCAATKQTNKVWTWVTNLTLTDTTVTDALGMYKFCSLRLFMTSALLRI